GTATFTVSEVELGPGVADPWHRHPGAEHALVVFEGRGLVTVEDTTETLEPLVGIRVEAGLVHRGGNTSRTPLRYFVCTGPGRDGRAGAGGGAPAGAPPRGSAAGRGPPPAGGGPGDPFPRGARLSRGRGGGPRAGAGGRPRPPPPALPRASAARRCSRPRRSS